MKTKYEIRSQVVPPDRPRIRDLEPQTSFLYAGILFTRIRDRNLDPSPPEEERIYVYNHQDSSVTFFGKMNSSERVELVDVVLTHTPARR